MGKQGAFGWPVHAGFYINTNNFFPFQGAGWYDADLVYSACPCNRFKRIIYYYNIYMYIQSKC